MTTQAREPDQAQRAAQAQPRFLAGAALIASVCCVTYGRMFQSLYDSWLLPDSYYSHGFLVPLISLYFAWQKRAALAREPLAPWAGGWLFLAAGCGTLLFGDFLGLRLFCQVSLLPTLAGLILIFFGRRHLLLLWFPLLFLVFMIPIPSSMTQSVALRIKLFATECAVGLARLATLPMVRDGSYVHAGPSTLLVGEVCGGLRSLIALLAFGALMSYISKTRPWARVVIFAISGPVAVVANVLRIFGLCVVAYFWDSETASGRFHDVSGLLIFAVAFVLLFSVEGVLRKLAPAKENAP